MNEVQMCPTGYKVYLEPRNERSCGRIAVIYKDSILIKKNSVCNYISMECPDFTVTLPSNTINVSVIYGPPAKSVPSFADDFLKYMEVT